jgi:hypothetical protein
MSTMHDPALPMPRAAGNRNRVNPAPTLAAIRRVFDALRERHHLDCAVRGEPDCRPPVPTFFAFDVLDLVGHGYFGQRKDRWSR